MMTYVEFFLVVNWRDQDPFYLLWNGECPFYSEALVFHEFNGVCDATLFKTTFHHIKNDNWF